MCSRAGRQYAKSSAEAAVATKFCDAFDPLRQRQLLCWPDGAILVASQLASAQARHMRSACM